MARNRMRYLVHEMGWEKFQKMVLKERSIVEMTTAVSTARLFEVKGLEGFNQPIETKFSHALTKLPVINDHVTPESTKYERWLRTNVVPQKQAGYFTIFVTLEAGDITANQLRTLAGAIRELSIEGVARNTPQQNFAIGKSRARTCKSFMTAYVNRSGKFRSIDYHVRGWVFRNNFM